MPDFLIARTSRILNGQEQLTLRGWTVGYRCTKHWCPLPYPRTECPIHAALKQGEVHRVDNEALWRSDGSAVPVEYTSTAIPQESRLQGAVVVSRDISQRKDVERQPPDDIAPLAQHFLEHTCAELRLRPINSVSDSIQ